MGRYWFTGCLLSSSSSVVVCNVAGGGRASFNIKDLKTCDLYDYKVKPIAPIPISNCENYQVYCCSMVLKRENGQFPVNNSPRTFPLPCSIRVRVRCEVNRVRVSA